ncbi:MAG TPA: IS4 family transposase [Acetobacteraceae bacterium]|jgi:Transposase DDE domain|nr:IS4 family transposase [Acetobacteraceae bacterium]
MLGESLGRFGDARLERVGTALVASMQHNRTMCLHRLAKDRREARQFGEFLANYRVSVQEMRIRAGQQTGRRAAGRHVLAIQDTTELHFTTHTASKTGFGTGGNGVDLGLFLHPILAMDADNGGIIGLVDCAIINRTEGKVTDRRKRAAEDKESYRWLEGAITSGDVLAEAAMITMVADRESDIYDLFARRPANVQLLCRSSSDRSLSDGALLSRRCAEWREAERYTIDVPVRGTRPQRQANVGLRFGSVSLRRPDTAAADRPEAVAVAVVDVCEIDPPAGQDPVHWRLLTTHPVGSANQARQIVAWYRMRWTIEQVFRSLKSHCLRIEDSQMEAAGCFTKLAMVALIAAVRAMQLVKARDGSTGQPITDAVSQADLPALRSLSRSLEGRTEKLKNPFDPTTLAWLAWIVARLGGWSGYTSKGYKPAGPKTMHHGLLRLDGILTGWNLANRSADDGLP